MTQSPVGADIDQALDIHRYFRSKRTLDSVVILDHGAQLGDIGVGKLFFLGQVFIRNVGIDHQGVGVAFGEIFASLVIALYDVDTAFLVFAETSNEPVEEGELGFERGEKMTISP